MPQQRRELVVWVIVRVANEGVGPLVVEEDGVAAERSRTQEVRRDMVQGVLGCEEVVDVGRMMWAWVWEVMLMEVEVWDRVGRDVDDEDEAMAVGSAFSLSLSGSCAVVVDWFSDEEAGGAESGTGRFVVERSLGGVCR